MRKIPKGEIGFDYMQVARVGLLDVLWAGILSGTPAELLGQSLEVLRSTVLLAGSPVKNGRFLEAGEKPSLPGRRKDGHGVSIANEPQPPMAARFLQNIFPDAASRTLDLAKLTDRKPQVFQLLGAGRNP